MSRLRRVLQVEGGPSVLVASRSGYRLDVAAEQVDALHFDELVGRGRGALERGDAPGAEGALSAALALWRGAALADVRDLTIVRDDQGRISLDIGPLEGSGARGQNTEEGRR